MYVKREHLPKAIGGHLDDPEHPILPHLYYPKVFPELNHVPAEAWKTTRMYASPSSDQ